MENFHQLRAQSCEYTIPVILDKMYREWIVENNRNPLYFVIHPDDYRLVYGEYMSVCAINPEGKLMGIPVLVGHIVPKGEFRFVG